MKLPGFLLFGAFLLISINEISSFCFYDFIKTKIGADNRITSYCEHDGVVMMPGETSKKNCVSCSCTEQGMSCCGIGYNGGVMKVEGCTMKKLENCCFNFVHDITGEECMPTSCPK